MTAAPPHVLVLGAGSIGARHARNLLDAGARVSVADPCAARAEAVAGAESVPFDLDHLHGHDAVVVASPTVAHAEQAQAALAAGARVLVEKPLATKPADALALAEAADRVAVGYNLRFHAPVRRLVELVHEGAAGRPVHVRAWFGSHLPDWRPGTDHRASYSGRADLGGGVLLDATHELDLLVWLLDAPLEVVGAEVATRGELGIDVEDSVHALLRAEGGPSATVELDYLSRRYRRGVEVVGTEATVRLDWARRVLEVEDGLGVRTERADTPVARSYRDEAAALVGWLQGGAPLPVDAATGLRSLELADAIREAS